VKESEIRPRQLFDRYLELSAEEIARFFRDRSKFLDVACPACGSASQGPGLTKLEFRFVTCADCASLYVSPRPSADMIGAYYRESKAVKFWETHFFKETDRARREKIFQPRAALIAEVQARVGAGRGTLVDVGSGYGILLEEIARRGLFESVVGIEPAPNLADVCRRKGFKVIEKAVEDIGRGEMEADVVTSFEVLEHVFDPAAVMAAMRRLVRPGGILLFTTLTVSGFDIQVLWERSDSVHPPMHINLLSVDGIKRLAERSGFDILEISTPGKLDVDIVANAVGANPELPVPRFVRTLLGGGDAAREEFQAFLQRHCLSSHVRVIATVR
jgi:SAM-dependent methyltransferase